MSIQTSSSLYGLDESLSRSDQELFSIFLRYPDAVLEDDYVIARTSRAELNRAKNNLTTPSKQRQGQISDSSTLIEQHREPFVVSRHQRPGYSDLGVPVFDGQWNELKALLDTSTLPDQCLRYYNLLGETIMSLGTEIFSTIRPGRTSNLTHLGTWLLKNISYSHNQANLQVQVIASLKESAAFTLQPSPRQIWSTYSQRARMIARNLALPSKQELTIIQCLVFLYNTCVYDGLLHGLADSGEVERLLNDIYDTFMSWLYSYKQWCCGMQELKIKYLQQLTDDFDKHPEAQDEYNDFQYRLRKLRTALANPLPDTAGMTEDVVQKLNLSARRPGSNSDSRRLKTRYKREYTV